VIASVSRALVSLVNTTIRTPSWISRTKEEMKRMEIAAAGFGLLVFHWEPLLEHQKSVRNANLEALKGEESRNRWSLFPRSGGSGDVVLHALRCRPRSFVKKFFFGKEGSIYLSRLGITEKGSATYYLLVS
jgi:hypothetical protein